MPMGRREYLWNHTFFGLLCITAVFLFPAWFVAGFSFTLSGRNAASGALDASVGVVSERDTSVLVKDSEEGHHKPSEAFPQSAMQLLSSRSSSPAVLLTSGPGTGKTYTLASRVAYLLNNDSCPPDRMVIMSFSNRDAEVLKSKALDQVFQSTPSFPLTRQQLADRLWSGTIHKFAGNIIGAYSNSKRRVRLLSGRDATMRIDRCLRQLLDVDRYKEQGEHGTKRVSKYRVLHRDALVELQQSRDVMIHQIGRCIELWKEASILPPPSVHGIVVNLNTFSHSRQQTRDNCLELATRLGITQNVAFLAWTVFPMYQVRVQGRWSYVSCVLSILTNFF